MMKNLSKDDDVYITDRDKLEPKELYKCFYKASKGVAPSEKLVNLFVELMEETESETN